MNSALKHFLRAPAVAVVAALFAVSATSMMIVEPAFANGTDKLSSALDERPTKSARKDKRAQARQLKREQRQLAKQSRQELRKKARKGERLAQVTLANDYAAEAQLLTFAPAAANDALSDALQWYAIAAQRGFPGAASLDNNGVSFHAVRVVRNR